MDDRSKKILMAVIQSYINSAIPVGSRYLGKHYSLGICPATIRNTMADLEELGFLSQPHTSAGRIPTNRGYKFYVDEIIGYDMVSDEDLYATLFDNLLKIKGDLEDYFSEITRTLSEYSQYMGFTVFSTLNSQRLRKLELVFYKEKSIVAILLTEEGVVKHRVIEMDIKLKQSDLITLASYINNTFAGSTLEQIRNELLDDIYLKKAQCDSIISQALNICRMAVSCISTDVYMYGMSRMLNFPDFYDIKKIKELFKAVEDKHNMIKILDRIIEAAGIQVLVGSEADPEFEDLSMVVSPFHDRGRPFGVIGLIGPKRMNYKSAISIVDTSVRFLSEQLEKRQED